MSAALLREAAALMRERARAATLDPRSGAAWMVDPDDSDIVLAPKDGAGWDGIAVAQECQSADAEHIASWHPAVALAVADWLDETAANLDALMSYGTETPALTVARAYLGRDS